MQSMSMHHETHSISIPLGSAVLEGNLTIPNTAKAVVLFAHGSGSSRNSPRNCYVAKVLQEGGLATLLIDLLTPSEEAFDQKTRHLRFDIGHLAERLMGTTDWLMRHPTTKHFKIGYFGASTGAAAALVTAVERRHIVSAIVSRGGRPDLAGSALSRVQAPTLLIVGGQDDQVIKLNQKALKHLNALKQLKIVPSATHLFEEPGTLEQVAELARDWFKRYLVGGADL